MRDIEQQYTGTRTTAYQPPRPVPLNLPDLPCWLYARPTRHGGLLEVDLMAAGPEFTLPAALACELFRLVFAARAAAPRCRPLTVRVYAERGLMFVGVPREALPGLAAWCIEQIGDEIRRQAAAESAQAAGRTAGAQAERRDA